MSPAEVAAEVGLPIVQVKAYLASRANLPVEQREQIAEVLRQRVRRKGAIPTQRGLNQPLFARNF